jgi:acetyltransferase-like isoleucine patch superfamily enzyme
MIYRVLQKIYFIKSKLYTLIISIGFKKFGKSIVRYPFSKLLGAKYITIGDNVVFHKNIVLTAWDSYRGQNFEPEIIIKDGASIGDDCHISSINRIVIGKNVLFGKKITIVDNSHGLSTLESIKKPPAQRQLFSKGPLVISDNVWIGDKCTVLAGVTIGINSIIGSNSVVTKDIPPNSVVVGVPGRIIKTI